MEAKRKSNAGRKPKIGTQERERILAIVEAGASISDAASIIGVSNRTIRQYLHDNPDFRIGVNKAAKNGKLRLIEKVGTADQWQAAAWMLERKWGREFGKKLDVTSNGKTLKQFENVDVDEV